MNPELTSSGFLMMIMSEWLGAAEAEYKGSNPFNHHIREYTVVEKSGK